jgi:hypothetical protein
VRRKIRTDDAISPPPPAARSPSSPVGELDDDDDDDGELDGDDGANMTRTSDASRRGSLR